MSQHRSQWTSHDFDGLLQTDKKKIFNATECTHLTDMYCFMCSLMCFGWTDVAGCQHNGLKYGATVSERTGLFCVSVSFGASFAPFNLYAFITQSYQHFKAMTMNCLTALDSSCLQPLLSSHNEQGCPEIHLCAGKWCFLLKTSSQHTQYNIVSMDWKPEICHRPLSPPKPPALGSVWQLLSRSQRHAQLLLGEPYSTFMERSRESVAAWTLFVCVKTVGARRESYWKNKKLFAEAGRGGWDWV